MSRILFLENRHQTRTWEAIATGLAAQGHQVSWIVFNHGFAPRAELQYRVPYPRRRDLVPAGDRFQSIVSTDRQIRYFGKTSDHYVHYDQHIRAALAQFQPELVIGEATQYFELLTIEACRDARIPYIVPTTARYPTGRFVCLLYDTLDVVGGSAEIPGNEELRDFVSRVANRAIVPDYMKGVQSGKKPASDWRTRRDWAFKAVQYVSGERYSSPSPWRKLQQVKMVRRNFGAWNRLAQQTGYDMATETKIRVLYPLQMQPEANVDVWGRPYNDQAAFIEQLSDILGDTAILFVKPNPKPKCELSDAMIQDVGRLSNVVPLASSVSMQHAFSHADLIVTITGTVAYEAVFARKPCVTLIRSRINDLAGCRFAPSPIHIADSITDLKADRFGMHSEEEVVQFAKRLYAESYPGKVQDPFSTPESATPQNRELVISAFCRLIPEFLKRASEPVCCFESEV
jgi:hypothetical protein